MKALELPEELLLHFIGQSESLKPIWIQGEWKDRLHLSMGVWQAEEGSEDSMAAILERGYHTWCCKNLQTVSSHRKNRSHTHTSTGHYRDTEVSCGIGAHGRRTQPRLERSRKDFWNRKYWTWALSQTWEDCVNRWTAQCSKSCECYSTKPRRKRERRSICIQKTEIIPICPNSRVKGHECWQMMLKART